MKDSVAVIRCPIPSRPEDVGGMTVVELLVHQDDEVRKLAQEIVRRLLQDKPLKFTG